MILKAVVYVISLLLSTYCLYQSLQYFVYRFKLRSLVRDRALSVENTGLGLSIMSIAIGLFVISCMIDSLLYVAYLHNLDKVELSGRIIFSLFFYGFVIYITRLYTKLYKQKLDELTK